MSSKGRVQEPDFKVHSTLLSTFKCIDVDSPDLHEVMGLDFGRVCYFKLKLSPFICSVNTYRAPLAYKFI